MSKEEEMRIEESIELIGLEEMLSQYVEVGLEAYLQKFKKGILCVVKMIFSGK